MDLAPRFEYPYMRGVRHDYTSRHVPEPQPEQCCMLPMGQTQMEPPLEVLTELEMDSTVIRLRRGWNNVTKTIMEALFGNRN